MTARAVPILLFLGLWEIVAALGFAPRDILPPVHSIAARAVALGTTGELGPNLLTSLGRAALGFVIATCAGIVLGALMSRSRAIEGFVNPVLALSYPIPKPAFFPLFLIWLGLGSPTHVAVIVTGCIIPVVISTYNGARRVNHHMVWTAQNFGMSPTRIIWRIVLPAALPDIVVGVRVALTLSFVMLVSSEMLAGQTGLGFLASYLGEGGDYEGMFAVVLMIGLLGFFADQAYGAVSGRLLAPYRD
jgi:ABC-type nitrate/sulfonate/bicarbonate transport system permease component